MWPELKEARLLRRYKRFLADVEFDSGEQATVHCPNTGAMTGCVEAGARVWLSVSDNPKRKYAMTWELIELTDGSRVCIHSALANRVVARAIEDGAIPELAGYARCRREVKYGDGGRVDFLLEGEATSDSENKCYVEVKSVTLALGGGLGAFPDAVSDRASRHLRELITVAASGDRAVLLLLAMHTGIRRVAPADHIDAVYGDTLREALAAGVEVLACGCEVSPEGVRLSGPLEFLPELPANVLNEV